jgi:hypothetical protein
MSDIIIPSTGSTVPWQPVSTSTNVETSDANYLIDASTNPTFTLPSTPTAGQTVGLWMFAGSRFDIALNSQKINGETPTKCYVTKTSQIFLEYSGSTFGWITSNGDVNYANAYTAEVLADSPWSYLQLNETSGTVADDSSGNGRTGTYNNCTLNQSSLFSYTNNRSVRFGGSNSFIVIPTQLNNPTNYTVETIFQTAGNSAGGPNAGVFMFGNTVTIGASAYDRELRVIDGILNFRNFNGSNYHARANTLVNDGYPHIVTVSYSSSAGSIIYLDGRVVGRTITTGSENINGFWKIGMTDFGGGGYFNGFIDEAAIFTSVLSPSRILAHHKAFLN